MKKKFKITPSYSAMTQNNQILIQKAWTSMEK